MFDGIPHAFLTLLLRKLPPLPRDTTPGAQWTPTHLRRLFERVPALLPPGMAPPMVVEAYVNYLAQASDAQLATVAVTLGTVADEIRAAHQADGAPPPTLEPITRGPLTLLP